MPQFTQKDNTGALFLTEKENDRQPDWSGNAVINGVAYFVSAWKKEAKSNGREYLSISFTPKSESRRVKKDTATDHPKAAARPAPVPPGAAPPPAPIDPDEEEGCSPEEFRQPITPQPRGEEPF